MACCLSIKHVGTTICFITQLCINNDNISPSWRHLLKLPNSQITCNNNFRYTGCSETVQGSHQGEHRGLSRYGSKTNHLYPTSVGVGELSGVVERFAFPRRRQTESSNYPGRLSRRFRRFVYGFAGHRDYPQTRGAIYRTKRRDTVRLAEYHPYGRWETKFTKFRISIEQSETIFHRYVHHQLHIVH